LPFLTEGVSNINRWKGSGGPVAVPHGRREQHQPL